MLLYANFSVPPHVYLRATPLHPPLSLRQAAPPTYALPGRLSSVHGGNNAGEGNHGRGIIRVADVDVDVLISVSIPLFINISSQHSPY